MGTTACDPVVTAQHVRQPLMTGTDSSVEPSSVGSQQQTRTAINTTSDEPSNECKNRMAGEAEYSMKRMRGGGYLGNGEGMTQMERTVHVWVWERHEVRLAVT
jgi:hypothetical protein